MGRTAFSLALVVIVTVSAVDVFWCVALRDELISNERNPMAVAIMRAGGVHGVALFVSLKMLATFAVVCLCRAVRRYRPRWSWPIVASVAAFQVALVWYLFFGHVLA